jgi:hypothetical protein
MIYNIINAVNINLIHLIHFFEQPSEFFEFLPADEYHLFPFFCHDCYL